MNIRKAEMDDLPAIIAIYKSAQDFMIKTGNPTQWGHSYPTRDLVKKDICKRICYLICDDDSPHGVFALFNKDEPTYQYIENGNWLNEDEYITLHRIASDGKLKGIFNFLIEYCKNISNNIRIDTHPNNHIMQNQIEKNDFKKCGTIYVADGSARIAYQWSKNHE
ncbi:hypothetical protein [Methanobrevibacter sp. UBA188]|uniref:hypothetical protein n=1 Tax=Methanobrevibacter sp. UBA188 TaxID=1915473 RepID=UPI0025D4160F|nr:hypothetical protein [Methanobrevibacter sp. UBA188]